MLNQIILVGIGGFLGSVSRFGISLLFRSILSHPFSLATLFVNAAGCLAVGFVFEFFKNHQLFPSMTLFLAVGFLGSFTTFSAFSVETLSLLRSQQLGLAALNIMGNFSLCLLCVYLGAWAGSLK